MASDRFNGISDRIKVTLEKLRKARDYGEKHGLIADLRKLTGDLEREIFRP